ncbi:MAG: methyl-accepting chemotaxis protein [Elusimicrobia bacterium]|nr:methyl-accepting chemotaxis protein [Elusimicrobiota bacterium]
MAEPQKFQRRTVLVKRQLQFKYVGLVFLSVLCASLIIGGDIYYNMYRLIMNEAPSLAAAAAQFNAIILVKLVLYLALMLLISVFVSHRFAGPIFRFERSAQSVAKGDLTHRVSLRTGDELMELQEEFNAMIAGLQALVQKDRSLAEHLAARVDEIARKLPEGAAAARADLASLKLELQHLTQAFKV